MDGGLIMPVKLNGSTSGYVELKSPAVGGSTSLELPTDSIKPGMVLVNETTFSAASTVSVNNCFSATYESYRIIISHIQTDVAGAFFRLRAGGSDISATNYWYGSSVALSSGAAVGNNANQSATYLDFYGGSVGSGVHIADVVAPNLSAPTRITFQSALSNGTNIVSASGGGLYTTNTQADGFTFYPASGTTTGTIRVYGYRNSL